MNYTLDSGSIVHRYKYGYDLAGNRTYAWARQAIGPDGTTTHTNDRSYLYTYDDLHRLIDAKLGKLNSTNDGIDPNGPTPRETHWDLDNLGNWSGGDPANGSVVITEGANTETIHHATNTNNQIAQIYQDGTSTAAPVHDPAGNLVFDGVHYFQYDAFNRLVQVNLIGTATLDANGKIAGGELGRLIARYMYDGLGRLIRKSTPIKPGFDDYDDLQHKDYYYDGVRRIQEVITRPGDQPAIYLNDELPDTVDPSPLAGYTTVWTDREYVWGPGYVDELVCQVDRAGAVMYAIQDANDNLMALTDASGNMLEQYTYDAYGTPRVAETYSPPHAVNRIGHQGLFYDRFDGTMDDPSLEPNAVGLYYNRNRSYAPHLGRFMQRDPNETAALVTGAAAMNGSIAEQVLDAFQPMAHYADGMNLYQYQGSNPINVRDPLGLSIMDDVDDFISGYYAERAAFAERAAGRLLNFAKTVAYSAVLGVLSFYFPPLAVALGVIGAANAILDIQENGFNAYNVFDLATSVGLAAFGVNGSIAMAERGIAAARGAITRLGGYARRLRGSYQRGTPASALTGKRPAGCFVAGSLICIASGLAPIETIKAGDRVLTTDDSNASEIDPRTWRLVTLSMPKRDGSNDAILIRALRPQSWLERTRACPGAAIWFTLPEMGITGPAKVQSVEACPQLQTGPGRVVLSTVTQLSSHVLRIWLEGLTDPLEPTIAHRLYSYDREDWMSAGHLSVGEWLRTAHGRAQIVRIERKTGVHRVYNLEVETRHCYYVSAIAVLSHNVEPCAWDYEFVPGVRETTRAGAGMNFDDAVLHVQGGGDVVANSRSTAKAIAEAAGDGRAYWEEAHRVGQLHHYHPLDAQGNRIAGMGHVYYGKAK